MSATNKTLIFNKVPAAGLPIAGEDLVVNDLGPFDPATPPPPGGMTLSILQASLDPFLTDKMRDLLIESYTPAYTLGSPVTNDAVARVIQSSAPGFAAGDLVLANLPFAKYVVLDATGVASEIRAMLLNPFGWHGHDLGLFVGPLGGRRQTHMWENRVSWKLYRRHKWGYSVWVKTWQGRPSRR